MRSSQIGCKMTYSSRIDICRFSVKVKKGAAVIGCLMGGRGLWKHKTPGEVGDGMEEAGEPDGKYSRGSDLSDPIFHPIGRTTDFHMSSLCLADLKSYLRGFC